MPLDLYRQSVAVILANQHVGGAYAACPRFAPYRFAWLRDGAFTAYAMDLAGQAESAHRFHDFASRTVLRYEQRIHQGIAAAARGVAPSGRACLHSRYTLDGMEVEDEWGHHQVDGPGTWLWTLAQHVARNGTALPDLWRRAAGAVTAYLRAVWPFPCYDCWEEHGDGTHTYSLAAVYAGLRAAADLGVDAEAARAAEAVRDWVLAHAAGDHLVKHVGSTRVDANLLGVAVPYGLLAPDDDLMRQTVLQIERELRGPYGGVHRYASDSYYGGGEWVLLTAWLGWYYAEAGELERAEALRRWVEAQAGPEGDLPEQVPADLNEPAGYLAWQEKWGPIASPLLWSHAQYIILCQSLRAQEECREEAP